jgi:predicted house-cleaning noncanonical NTP pyrophosphatase (MazG superfamily)
MKKVFNKLVRDRIPEILAEKGVAFETTTLDDIGFSKELMKKLIEEANELVEARSSTEDLIKEIGDVYEVINAIVDTHNLDRSEIDRLQIERAQKRGKFEKKIFLVYTEENEQ